MTTLKVTNPFTGEVYEVQEATDVGRLFEDARERFARWRDEPVAQRVQTLKQALDVFSSRRDEMATSISQEMGKPIALAKAEIERAIEEWRYMLDNAESFLEPEKVDSVEIHFAPLGVVAVISPWNFPVLLPLRGIVPALLAGNAVLFKPSEFSPGTAIRVAEILSECAPLVPVVGGKDVGAQVVELPVAAIVFTGSTSVGKAIASKASHSMKRVLLELGGLDAAIVLADADVSPAAREIVRANARNSGQVCNAVKRVLVHESIYEKFVTEACEASRALVYGDPLYPSTDVGPLVSKPQLDRVKSFLDDAVAKGAKTFSVPVPSRGFFFPQTILTHVPSDARLLHEEPFGPLLPIVPFSSEEQAIQIANDTRFGLTASVWTVDSSKAKKIAARLDVGMVRHNSHAAMHSGIPWGGCKESGIGRMKTKEGLREFANVKVVG
jgi:acyl-CoA reductase-like NAD-dependent aldehyde dehydrogenase